MEVFLAFSFLYEGGGFVRLEGNRGIAPSSAEFGGYFIDLNGDSWADFISVQLGGVEVFMNQRNGFFEESTEASRIFHNRSTVSVAASDIDLDGDIDLAFAHWGTGMAFRKATVGILVDQRRFRDLSGPKSASAIDPHRRIRECIHSYIRGH